MRVEVGSIGESVARARQLVGLTSGWGHVNLHFSLNLIQRLNETLMMGCGVEIL